MADPKGTKNSTEQPKEPFVSQDDRPEVRLKPDTPLTELRVRDLAAIIGAGSGKTPFENKTSLKDFFDKPFPEVAKDWLKEIKPEKYEKSEIKELKGEKHEKIEKHEKHEKREIKELKAEKLEHDGVFDPGELGRPPPDPRFEQVIQAVAGLAKQVSQLADQVEELRKKTSG
jgi:hypothetical protein